MQNLLQFLEAVESDIRVTTSHISLYMALWKKWKDTGDDQPLCFFRHEILGLCKISGSTTFHKVLRDLHEFGYIKYTPSYNHFLGSLVQFTCRKRENENVYYGSRNSNKR